MVLNEHGCSSPQKEEQSIFFLKRTWAFVVAVKKKEKKMAIQFKLYKSIVF